MPARRPSRLQTSLSALIRKPLRDADTPCGLTQPHRVLTCRDDTADQRAKDAAQNRGQFLARQERWDCLAAEVATADAQRQATPTAMPLADLLLYGARADVVLAADHAVAEDRPVGDPALVDGIAALEAMRRDEDAHPMLDLLVALAHMDLGWIWHRANTPFDTALHVDAHFDRATQLLAPLVADSSPALTAAKCALISQPTVAPAQDTAYRMVQRYTHLIGLQPQNFRPMRALGAYLLPEWIGSYRQVEETARRIMRQTHSIWGRGGYTWVWLDAASRDAAALDHLDLAFFENGLRDIVERRPAQDIINLLAAACAVAPDRTRTLENDAPHPFKTYANWLIRDYLTEVHPLAWAHATTGFDNAARIGSLTRFAARGRAAARVAIAAAQPDPHANQARLTLLPFPPTGASA